MEIENTFWLFSVSIAHNSMAILYLNTHKRPTNSTQPHLLTTFWLFFFLSSPRLAVRFFLLLGFFFIFFFYFFLLGSVSLGTEEKKKKLHRATGMGLTNSVKNIEWWEVSDSAKQTWYFRVMSDEWWKIEWPKIITKQGLRL